MEEYVRNDLFEERMKRVDDENERQNARIKELEKTFANINSLTLSVEKMAVAVTNMQRELERQGSRLEAIEDEPGEKWKTVVKVAITAIVTAVITFFLSKGGF